MSNFCQLQSTRGFAKKKKISYEETLLPSSQRQELGNSSVLHAGRKEILQKGSLGRSTSHATKDF